MNDRELLEAAAKAAGLTVVKAYDDGALRVINDGPQFRWNPLNDDGDALRLAVTLDMDINIESAFGHTRANECFEDHGTDSCAATRRAIVRAAAAMVTR